MEKLYQYLWKSRMFGKTLKDADGASIEIVDPGILNTDAGPDFFNSKIKINSIEWVGNVEIHVKASDWKRHHHDSDPSYDSIILHVVSISDTRIYRHDGSLIPQVEITLPEDLFKLYASLEEPSNTIKCGRLLNGLSQLSITDWLESLSIERVQAKAQKVKDLLTLNGNDWEQTCFVMVARALGFGLNGDPFEMLSRSVPLRILHHHSDNPLQIQAILFGQAAMLDSSLHIFDEYYQLLCREYYFLARKYGLNPMRPGLWKYARTRPQNFPHRRIAFLAKACESGFSLFSKFLSNAKNSDNLTQLFNWELTGYWHTHFSFDVVGRCVSDTLSDASITLIIINAVAPLIYAYGASLGDYDLAESGLDLLSSLPAENNSITRDWTQLGIKSDNALRSQALIHLRKEYCNARKCFSCRWGHLLMRKEMRNIEQERKKHHMECGIRYL